jgi:hypothetical protein
MVVRDGLSPTRTLHPFRGNFRWAVIRPVPWNLLPKGSISTLAIRLQPWNKPGTAWHYMERTTSIGTSRCCGVNASPNCSRNRSKNSSRVRSPLTALKS